VSGRGLDASADKYKDIVEALLRTHVCITMYAFDLCVSVGSNFVCNMPGRWPGISLGTAYLG
jgi:hypothetical protein